MGTSRAAAIGLRLVLAIAFLLGLGTARSTYAQEGGAPPVAGEAQPQVASGSPPDITPPAFVEPLDLQVAAADASGAAVIFDLPVAADDVDGPVAVACDWQPGAIFPLGTWVVTCTAHDAAGNVASVDFLVSVYDQTPPIIAWPPDVYVAAPDASGAYVSFAMPYASDNVDGSAVVSCDVAPGAFFPVGVTAVTCWASDLAGNAASAVSFSVVVEAPPLPTAVPTDVPVEPTPVETEVAAPETPVTDVAVPDSPVTTDATMPASEAIATQESMVAGEASDVVTPEPTAVATETPTPEPTVTSVATVPVVTPVPDPLPLPWPLPGDFVINYDGGPLNGINLIWGYEDFPVSQEFGHTEFSILNHSWYTYGTSYGLDGFSHPGLDIGMPAGTWLYSPVEGTVRIAGGVPGYTYYGNWAPGVGQLLIVTDAGDEIVLGHMGGIAVGVGERVSVGQFVGVSGGYNGDHLHLEVRQIQSGGWFLAVDPRQSVIVTQIEAASQPKTGELDALPDTTGEAVPMESVSARVPDLTPLSQAVTTERQIANLATVLPLLPDQDG